MEKLNVVIDTNQTGFRITIPGVLIEQNCPLHQQQSAKDKAISLLTNALAELKEFKIK